MPRRRHPWWDLPLTIAIALVVMLALTRFVAQPFSIPSGSMEDTLQVGDRVLVSKLAYRSGSPQRGDVIVFDGTDSFVPASSAERRDPVTGAVRAAGQSLGLVAPDGTDFVKRVIGTGGDRVACCDDAGRVTVNGAPLAEPYLRAGDAPSDEPFDVEVPQGMLFVMGDHRSDSADSRAHLGDPGGGMVPASRVIGQAVAVLWPPSRIGAVAGGQP